MSAITPALKVGIAAEVILLLGTVLSVVLMQTIPAILCLIVAAMLPFFLQWEHSRPRAREVVLIAVLAALAVAGRAAFFMLPNIKPLCAIVIISGLCLGPRTGFLVGTLSMLLSNMLFSQGIWTPFQMLAAGILGALAGFLFFQRTFRIRWIVIYGFFATLFIYGGLVDLSSLLFMINDFSWQSVISVYASGFSFSLIHAISTAAFLCLLTGPMVRKLTRMRIKYGLLI